MLITGPPGIGKTSTLRRSVKELKKREYTIGGIICREVREGGVRVGFEIMDLSTGQRGWLAHVNQPEGPRIGKYLVNLTDLEVIGAGSILAALQNADLLAIDEIGPMELSSPAFSNALARGYCSKHYQQVRKYGRVTPERAQRQVLLLCKIAGCEGEQYARGYCNKHYQRWWRAQRKAKREA